MARVEEKHEMKFTEDGLEECLSENSEKECKQYLVMT
jgi:hypothetical protein